MLSLAISNLFYDKIRLAVTLTGVVFAVILASVQTGLFIGFARSTSSIIDNSQADLWVAKQGTKYLEMGLPFSESKFFQAQGIPGVERAEKLAVGLSFWKKPNGVSEQVMLVGADPDSQLSKPWSVVAGNIEDLRQNDTVMIDELYRERLGVSKIGETIEIGNRRARVVGFTRGIRTFTILSLVFTSFKNAQNYAALKENETVFILVKASPGTNLLTLKQNILSRIPDVEVYSVEEFSQMSQSFWMFSTGAGISLIVAAVLGLVIGLVVVAQTIYGSTVEYTREYGTLKAIGTPNSSLYRLIIYQAIIVAIIGYVIGIIASFGIARMSHNQAIAVIVPWQVAVAMFGLTLTMCVVASLLSVNQVTRIDPALVFKN